MKISHKFEIPGVRIITTLVLFLLSFSLFAQKNIYVSNRGDDSNSGSRHAPVASLHQAQKLVREFINDSDETVIVNIESGKYNLDQALVFSMRDGGKSINQKVIWKGDAVNMPVITAEIDIENWKIGRSPKNLPPDAKGKVWSAKLPEGVGLFKTMYDNGSPLKRARGKGFKSRIDPYGRDGQGDLRFLNKMYVDEQAEFGDWDNITDLELVIRPYCLWTMNILPIAGIDKSERSLKTQIHGTYYLTKERYNRFGNEHAWIENIPEGMTSPGTWCVNTKTGTIYYWPESGRPEKVTVPILKEYILVEGEIDYNGPVDVPVKNLHFMNLKFINNERDTWTRNDKGMQHDWEMMDKGNAFFRFRGAENCVLENCEFAYGGGSGIRLDLHCQNIVIRNNYIHDIGGTGILLCGYGAGTKDVNKKNIIENNCVQRNGIHYWHSAGIAITQSGENRISNNLISETPYNGLAVTGYRLYYFSGKVKRALDRSADDPDYYEERAGEAGIRLRENSRSIRYNEIRPTNEIYASHRGDRAKEVIRELLHYQPFIHCSMNIIEYNEVRNVLQVLGDGNGLYISDTGPYNVIRNNYFHHTEGVHGVAVRTDHLTHNTLIESNIIWKFAGGLAVGHNNHAINNIIADVGGVEFTEGDRYDTKRIEVIIDYARTGGYRDGMLLQNVGYQPENRTPYFGNLSRLDTSEINIVDDNYYFWKSNVEKMEKMIDSLKVHYGFDINSQVIDPGFVDPENGDFRLRADSPLPSNGFKEIKQDEIGLRESFPFRLISK